MSTLNPDILDGSGFEPHKVRFRVKQIDKTPASTFTLESRQLAFAVYVTPVWPQPQTELLLGPFHCVGCIIEDGIKKWGPLGCPVHTPSQSHPIRDALETLARESATRKAMIAALMEVLSGFSTEYLHTEGQERRELSKYIREAPTPEERAQRQAECFTKLYMPSQSALQKAVKP